MDVDERRPLRRAVLAAMLAMLAVTAAHGCEKSGAEPKGSAPKVSEQPGHWYRASLKFGAKLPPLNFFLRLPDAPKGQAEVVNGEERVQLTSETTGDGVRLTTDWSYDSEIVAKRTGDLLQGTWRRFTPLWGDVTLPFEARPIDDPSPERRYDGPASAVSLDGNWELTFGEHGQGRAHLTQKGDVVTGYMRPGNLSDVRFLAGNVRGRTLLLSTFNGNAAYVVSAEAAADGKTMRGTMSLLNLWNEEFTGRRVAELPPVALPRLRDGAKKFSLPDLDKVKGKPALVVFFSTWCPSCNDAFPFIVELARRFRPRGVEVLGLNYELSEEVAETDRHLKTFRTKYGIEFDLIQVPTTPDKWASAMPPELEGWDGFPVFAFIASDGTVRHVVGGWWTSAAREQNRQLRQKFEQWMLELVPR